MKTRRTVLAALCLSATVGIWAKSSEAGGEVIVVIVNKGNPASSLGASELRPIFQTTKTSWGSGGDATPFNLPEDNELRQNFDQAVLGLDPDHAARYWKDRKIRGGARAPKQLPSTGAVLKAVAANAGAVGYVKASEANATVKVIAKIVGGKLSGS
jgi:ABC-type phosphate transport system substrate-binding protein